MFRFALAGLLVLAACAPSRVGLRGECLEGCAATALVQVGLAVAAEALAEPSEPFCDENDPPHTCPGTTPGPLTPPAPRD